MTNKIVMQKYSFESANYDIRYVNDVFGFFILL